MQQWFQSSFELTGYITKGMNPNINPDLFQSSFELTGYITLSLVDEDKWSSSFKALSSLQVI